MPSPDIFLSYNREDQAVARRFADGFAALGLDVWWDVALHSGETYDQVTEEALRTAKAVVVLWSKKSAVSRWVRSEATLADRKGTLVPAMIEPCERPIMFELTQTADLSSWQGAPDDRAWRAFAADVERMVGRVPQAEAVLASPVVQKQAERGELASLAILPFVNRSGLPEDEVFAEGMVEDLVAAMSGGFSVRVLATGVTAGYRKGIYTDITAVGHRLGVRYLLEGNVRRVGDALRVTTQVVEAETGEVLWSGRFDRPLSELARLQEELVADVFTTLEVRFQDLELQRALKKPSVITAWEAVNRAAAAQRQFDPTSIMRAVEEAQRAIDIDPQFALGHAHFAQAMGILYLFALPDDPATVQRIRQHIDKALSLGPDELYTVGLCSQALCCIGRPEEALGHMRRGVEKAPLVGPYHFNIGWASVLLNRVEGALQSLAEADRLMPGWVFRHGIRGWQASALLRAGRWDEAEAMIDEALAIHPDYDPCRQVKAVACLRTGRDAEARAVFAPVPTRGLALEQVLTFTRRVYINNPVADEICAGIRKLWAEAAP